MALQRDVPALAMVELSAEITGDARALLLRHTLRASDAVQLASCLYLQRQLVEPVPFVAFDGRLVLAARAEGLTVIVARGDVQRKVTKAKTASARHR
jgi:predicted nucleic acid-binding protein